MIAALHLVNSVAVISDWDLGETATTNILLKYGFSIETETTHIYMTCMQKQ